VFSSVGASLFGQCVGDTARWRTPNGDVCEAEIVSLLFQPEASGDYTT
jgi:regulator of nucleoside diphosphate kinase